MSHWGYSSWCSPCLCGKGTFRVHWESENYPPFRQFSDPKISCPECDRTYYLAVHSLTDVRVGRKCEHAARGTAVKARNAIWNSGRDVLALSVRLRLRLDASHDRTPGSRRERLSIAVGSTVQALGGTVRFHPSSRALGLARGDFIGLRWG